jgi:hypothetical protein
MSHNEFVLAYENGSLGCSVSVLLTLRLFVAGKVREKKVSINLLLWSRGFLLLIIASVIGFLNFPLLWALLGAVALLAIYALAFFYWVGEVVLSASLANKEFYEFAKAERALWIFTEDEKNLPKLQKALLIRRARRAQR